MKPTVQNNWVAKHSYINKASTHVDKKKQENNPRKQKYKQSFERTNYV